MQAPETLPQCWQIQTQSHHGSRQAAARQKEFGIWNRWTWDAEYAQVRDLALGLSGLNVRRGDRVAIIGDNDCQYLWATLALLAVGATLIGIPADATPTEVQYLLTHAEATLVFASDQEQCDKLLALKPTLSQVSQVIYWRDRGMWLYNDPWLLGFSAVQEQGRALAERSPEQFDALIKAGGGADVALLCYTAGVDSPPKAVLLSHTNILAASRALAAADPRRASDNYLSFMPLTTANGAMFELAAHVLDGIILNFAEKPETMLQNVREIAPDALLYPARLWENLAATIQLSMLDASWLNRRMYAASIGPNSGLLHTIGKAALLQPLLSQVGLHRARSAYTTGRRLDPAVLGFFHALGLPLRQLYSANEAAGAIAAQQGAATQIDSVGAALPGVTIRVAADGEIWVAGPNVCLGYAQVDAASAAALHTDELGVRWFRTGDVGRYEDGQLWFHDRQADMLGQSDGPALAPQSIEGALKWSPFITQALVFTDLDRSKIGALIVIDAGRTGRWAVERGLSFAGAGELASLPEVGALLTEEIGRINRILPEAAHVDRFVLMPRAWTADAGELTRTYKLRRGVIRERSAAIIAALWSDRPSVTDPASGLPLQFGRSEEEQRSQSAG